VSVQSQEVVLLVVVLVVVLEVEEVVVKEVLRWEAGCVPVVLPNIRGARELEKDKEKDKEKEKAGIVLL